MSRNRAKAEFGLLCGENRSSATIRRDILKGKAASFEILRAWIRDELWAWTTLDIDENIMHPVERLSHRLKEEQESRKRKANSWLHAQPMLAPSSPILFVAAFLLRDIIENRWRRYSALFLSLSDGESDAPHAVVFSGISLTARQPISVVNRHHRS